MREIRYSQEGTQLGNVNGILRIGGRNLFFKANNNQYGDQVIAQLESRGAEIEKSIKGWVRVDMFRNQSLVRIGEKEFDVNETSDQEIEEILFNFYLIQFTKAGFKCSGKNIQQ